LSTKLEKLKRIAEKHMEEQVKIIQILNSLSINEAVEFNKWHKNHHLYKEIPKMVPSLSIDENQ
jgi:hypothetical protein